jgi:hypothetical protein
LVTHLLATRKSLLQSHLKVEKNAIATTLTVEKNRLRLYLQLEKNLAVAPIATKNKENDLIPPRDGTSA